MGALIPFVLSNWRYVVMGVLALALGVQTLRLSWADQTIAETAAAQQKAIAEAQARADALSNELIIAQAASMAETVKTKTIYVDRIKNVPVTTACITSPAVRAGLSGVSDIIHGGSANPVSGHPQTVH